MFSYIKHVNSYIKGGYKACHEPAVFQQNKVTLHVHFVKRFVVAIPALKISNLLYFYFVIFFTYEVIQEFIGVIEYLLSGINIFSDFRRHLFSSDARFA